MKECFELFTQEETLDGDERPVSIFYAALHNILEQFYILALVYELHTNYVATIAQNCSKCKKRVRATKRFKIQKFPKILIIRIFSILIQL